MAAKDLGDGRHAARSPAPVLGSGAQSVSPSNGPAVHWVVATIHRSKSHCTCVQFDKSPVVFLSLSAILIPPTNHTTERCEGDHDVRTSPEHDPHAARGARPD